MEQRVLEEKQALIQAQLLRKKQQEEILLRLEADAEVWFVNSRLLTPRL